MRRSVHVSLLLAALFSFAACDIGSLQQGPGGPGGGPDGGPTPDGTPNPDGVAANCEQPQPPGNSGFHNAGTGCAVGGCHLQGNTGGGAPAFSVSGTLYDAGGVNGVGGATIVVTDGNGVTEKLITHGGAANTIGNFYSTNLNLTPPFTVRASACPDDNQMQAAAETGNCNSCHGGGNRIHLP